MDDGSFLDVEIEERVNDLLSRMTLEEKIGQLRAIRVSIRDFFSEILSELPEDKRVKIQNAIFSALREDREAFDHLLTSQIKKRWRKVLENEKCRVGMLTLILRNFSPKESAKLANEVQKFMIENSRLSIPVMIHDECLHGCVAKGSTIFP
ncbi:beta-glucosidase, partial [Candidatus Bathyarchaeota archaeon]|nr:beta-glucosidase [Candidatus Bathyarchaeota archaeon]